MLIYFLNAFVKAFIYVKTEIRLEYRQKCRTTSEKKTSNCPFSTSLRLNCAPGPFYRENARFFRKTELFVVITECCFTMALLEFEIDWEYK